MDSIPSYKSLILESFQDAFKNRFSSLDECRTYFKIATNFEHIKTSTEMENDITECMLHFEKLSEIYDYYDSNMFMKDLFLKTLEAICNYDHIMFQFKKACEVLKSKLHNDLLESEKEFLESVKQSPENLLSLPVEDLSHILTRILDLEYFFI